MQQFELSTSLSREKTAAVAAFLSETQAVSVFQRPEYASALYAGIDCFFITGSNNGQLNFFALLTRNGRKYCNIQFGPAATDEQVLHEGIKFIIRQFRYKALCLTVQLPLPGDASLPAGRSYDDHYNWSTLLLPVASSAEEQFRGFSKHHQRSIRKAERSGVMVRKITTEADARAFAAIYIQMYRHRKLYVNAALVPDAIASMQQLFAASGYSDGLIWGIYIDEVLAGGIIITYTNGVAFYYMGAADPGRRSVPLLHMAFAAAIDECRHRGINYFDFGGFASHAAAGSQEERINHFKIQFGGKITGYLPRLYFDLVPCGTGMLRLLRKPGKLIQSPNT